MFLFLLQGAPKLPQPVNTRTNSSHSKIEKDISSWGWFVPKLDVFDHYHLQSCLIVHQRGVSDSQKLRDLTSSHTRSCLQRVGEPHHIVFLRAPVASLVHRHLVALVSGILVQHNHSLNMFLRSGHHVQLLICLWCHCGHVSQRTFGVPSRPWTCQHLIFRGAVSPFTSFQLPWRCLAKKLQNAP